MAIDKVDLEVEVLSGPQVVVLPDQTAEVHVVVNVVGAIEQPDEILFLHRVQPMMISADDVPSIGQRLKAICYKDWHGDGTNVRRLVYTSLVEQ